MNDRLEDWLGRHQRAINLYLFANIAGYIGWQAYRLYGKLSFDLIETSFIAQNLVLAGVVLLRSDHLAVDRNVAHQLVALVAFFSGAALIGEPRGASDDAIAVSRAIVLAANVLGIATLFNLGKSFGILIAYRQIKTRGLYRLVRHPMYASDILLRVGYLVSHPTLPALVIIVASTVCYTSRALYEEHFLSQQPEYRAYMAAVRWRFIPFVL